MFVPLASVELQAVVLLALVPEELAAAVQLEAAPGSV